MRVVGHMSRTFEVIVPRVGGRGGTARLDGSDGRNGTTRAVGSRWHGHVMKVAATLLKMGTWAMACDGCHGHWSGLGAGSASIFDLIN